MIMAGVQVISASRSEWIVPFTGLQPGEFAKWFPAPPANLSIGTTPVKPADADAEPPLSLVSGVLVREPPNECSERFG